MNDAPENKDTERSRDLFTQYKVTNSQEVSWAERIDRALEESIVRHIQEAKTPEEIERWLQIKESIEIQKVRKKKHFDEKQKDLWNHQLKLFDEIRLTVFSSLFLSLGVTMIFLKMPQPGLVLVIMSSLRVLKYSLSEVSDLSGQFSKKSSIFAYLLSLISLLFYILIWVDISEGIQQALIVLMSLLVLFLLSIVKYVLEGSQLNSTIKNASDRIIESNDSQD